MRAGAWKWEGAEGIQVKNLLIDDGNGTFAIPRNSWGGCRVRKRISDHQVGKEYQVVQSEKSRNRQLKNKDVGQLAERSISSGKRG